MTSAVFSVVTPDYPSVMQIPVRRGRFFTDRDNMASPPVVAIDEVLARHVFPGQDPIGQQISLMAMGAVRIVGVVGHVKQWGLDSDDTNKIRDQIYFPVWQVPDKFMFQGVAGLTLMLRTRPEPMSMVSAVRAQVAGPTQDQPIYAVRTMEQTISGSVAERRFTMLVLIIFAATALLLAAVGIYGVMSYAVTRRTHELGIRAALGASRGEIVGLVLRQGMRLAAIGIAGGLAFPTPCIVVWLTWIVCCMACAATSWPNAKTPARRMTGGLLFILAPLPARFDKSICAEQDLSRQEVAASRPKVSVR